MSNVPLKNVRFFYKNRYDFLVKIGRFTFKNYNIFLKKLSTFLKKSQKKLTTFSGKFYDLFKKIWTVCLTFDNFFLNFMIFTRKSDFGVKIFRISGKISEIFKKLGR